MKDQGGARADARTVGDSDFMGSSQQTKKYPWSPDQDDTRSTSPIGGDIKSQRPNNFSSVKRPQSVKEAILLS
jgi:hypothetical protein